MKVFLDANILISVINKEYPAFTYTARILSLADKSRFQLYTSPLCLGISFYFAQKKYKERAKEKIKLLAQHISSTTVDEAIVLRAINNPAVADFEDGLEYYSAINSKCTCIITENVDDFYFSEIEVLKSEAFFTKYMTKSKS